MGSKVRGVGYTVGAAVGRRSEVTSPLRPYTGVRTTALARIAAATAMAGNTRQTRSGLRLWRGERWRPKNRIGGTVTSCEDEGRMPKDECSFDRRPSFVVGHSG